MLRLSVSYNMDPTIPQPIQTEEEDNEDEKAEEGLPRNTEDQASFSPIPLISEHSSSVRFLSADLA